MNLEMVSIWMPKVCRIGALKSQILDLFSVSMVCVYIVLSISIQYTVSHNLGLSSAK